jgi:hypothetical protein
MLNHWVVRTEAPFAAWIARMPAPTSPARVARIFELANYILEAGAAHEVYQVHQTPFPTGFHLAEHGSYAQFLNKQKQAGRPISLFHYSSGVNTTADGQLITPARLCYFRRDGLVTETLINDLGALLEELRPLDREWGSSYMARVAPVTLTSLPLRMLGEGVSALPFAITIELFTDIWFPQVLGLLEDKQPLPHLPRIWYSNATLAGLHTPRLNQFLAAIQQQVTLLGGDWEVVGALGTAIHYAPQVEPAGIRLW